MTLEKNRAVVRLMHEEVWSKGNLDLVDEIFTSDFICHFIVGSDWEGPEGVRQQVSDHRNSFPDRSEDVEDIIAEGDRVVTRWTGRGTHSGEFQGVPASGDQVEIAEVAVFRISAGKVAEQWGFPEIMSLLRQIGVNP